MREIHLVITDSLGLHARPAGLLARKVKAYKSSVLLEYGDTTIECKRMLAIMEQQIKKGDAITITIEGEDEDRAYEELKAFCEENM